MTRSNRAQLLGLVLFLTTPFLAWGQDLPAGAVMLTPSELTWKPLPAPVGRADLGTRQQSHADRLLRRTGSVSGELHPLSPFAP